MRTNRDGIDAPSGNTSHFDRVTRKDPAKARDGMNAVRAQIFADNDIVDGESSADTKQFPSERQVLGYDEVIDAVRFDVIFYLQRPRNREQFDVARRSGRRPGR